ncbi:MAG: tripartite tricarboxylate transporter substrate binding protein [Deltaproteobacteria bacterium]|nr:tripartite tricarboxylate transporter substrate binding protein [Deltaproteobacteria bacterium]
MLKITRVYRLSLMAVAAMLALFFVMQGTMHAAEKPKDFPTRPIMIIVPYGAGGGSDQLTRAFAISFEKIVGVPVTVVNKPGGGGVAGLSDFFAAPPDGYTLIEHIDDAATLYAAGRIKENPSKDWFPLAICQITFNQLYVRPDDKRFAAWDDFLKYAKKHPGKVSIANVAHKGSMERIVMNQLMEALGFKVTQISFDKPTERYGALVGGHVDVLFEQPGDVRRYIEANKMKPILTMLNERPSAFPDAPSYKDIGVDLKPLYRFRGFFIRKGVPENRVKWLEEACRKAFNSESFQKFNRSKYMHLIDSYRDVEGGKKLVRDTVETYKAMYKKLGIIK